MIANLTLLETALRHYHRSSSQVQSYAAIGKQIKTAYKVCQDQYQMKFGYTVFLDTDDLVYRDVLLKLRADIPTTAQRVLVANTSTQSGWDDDDDEEVLRAAHVDLDFGGRLDRIITLEGHRMRVAMSEASTRQGATRPGLYFFARSVAGRDAVVQMLSEMATKRIVEPEGRDPSLFLWSNGYWNRAQVPFRPLDSVILAEDQLGRIKGDLQSFLDNERFYVRRSIPWHRGYLFHGPPGTGKTSLVRGLAKQYGLDLFVVPLGDLKRDSELVNCVAGVRERSILLLEDVDVYSTARSRKGKDGKASLSGLLNTLDGVSTPHGLITILTTNHVDVIDPALLRPGRVDMSEQLNPPTGDQINALFTYFYEQEPTTDLSGISASSVAAVTEVFKRHLTDAAAAEQDLLENGVPEQVVVTKKPKAPRDDDEESAAVPKPRKPRVSRTAA